jgi:hypothetical protein
LAPQQESDVVIYQVLEGWTVLLVLVALFVLMVLQVAMFRRLGHASFLLFAIGSALCIIYSVLSAVPFYLQITDSQRLLLFQGACAAAVSAAVLAVWGTASLLRSCGRVFQPTRQAARGSASR